MDLADGAPAPNDVSSPDQAVAFMESLGLASQSGSTVCKSVPTLTAGVREDFWDVQLDLATEADPVGELTRTVGVKGKSNSLLSYCRPGATGKGSSSKAKEILPEAASHLPSLSMSPSQTDFMRQMNLMNVTTVGVEADVALPPRFRLWQPESEVGGPAFSGAVDEDALWRDMFHEDLDLDQACTTDPTLMEEEVAGVTSQARDPWTCQPCQRTLSSQAHFDQHLQSELHRKHVPPTELIRTTPRKRTANRKYAQAPPEDNSSLPDPSSAPTTGTVQCRGCLAEVNVSQFGKHLISHFHHHRSKLEKNDPAHRELVLDHIHEVTQLAPFQCEACSFYCNWDHDLLAHWRSEHHELNPPDHHFWCSFCNVYASNSHDMGEHLIGLKHHEIVVAISRCVPIKIKRVQLHACGMCERQFRLRFSLKRHMRIAHDQDQFRLEDHELFQCEHCPFSTHSFKSVQCHKFLAHPEKRSKYHCRICQLQFHSKTTCEKHRKSLEHRLKAKERSSQPQKCASCEFCPQTLANLIGLKEHIRLEHADKMSQCGLCGHRFALAQDLGAHVKSKCRTKGELLPGSLICGEESCTFTCDTMNMILFHQCLFHGDNRVDPEGKYECALCEKFFTRSKLWEHVQIHGESHRCFECYRIFKTKWSLNHHLQKTEHGSQSRALQCPKCLYETTSKKLLTLHEKRSHFQEKACPQCNQRFDTYSGYKTHLKSHNSMALVYKCNSCAYMGKSMSDLKKHRVSHSETCEFKCQLCSFECKRKSELNRHLKKKHIQSSRLTFRCSHCDYKCESSQHLQRHMKVHEGETRVQFQCRLCDHLCATEENLRKHILKTSKHPGASVYRCHCCPDFTTDAKFQYKSHLTEKHGDTFPNAFAISEHVKNYFIFNG